MQLISNQGEFTMRKLAHCLMVLLPLAVTGHVRAADAPAAASAAAASGAAQIVLLTGRATATQDDGGVRILAKGEALNAGEIISTGANSYLNMRFRDGAFILLRPNSRFQIEDYRYDGADVAAKEPEPAALKPAAPAKAPAAAKPAAPIVAAAAAPSANTRAFFKLLRGGFRAVSGLIGKANPNDYQVSTPVATIGIRGTDYIVRLVDPSIANDPAFAGAVPKGSPEGGAVVGVVSGGVFVTNQAGQQLEVPEGQYTLTLPNGNQVRLPFDPAFIRIDPIPNPQNFCE